MTSSSRSAPASKDPAPRLPRMHGSEPIECGDLVHGGDLDAARARFPKAPAPFVDLSTGINPYPYPISSVRGDDFSDLPAPNALSRLLDEAAAFYGGAELLQGDPTQDAPAAITPANVVAAPGSQILMALIADAVPKGRAAILGPTYSEHARVARLAGHAVSTHETLSGLGEAALSIVVNPNNPDGRVVARDELLGLAARQKAHGGLLVVDEAFMDVGPRAESLAPLAQEANIVVLRSFGKFFGLSGLRLSFALARAELAASLRARLGPWPVSGPALRLGSLALADKPWCAAARKKLKADGLRLQKLLEAAGLRIVGRTDLFCLVRHARAAELYGTLGEAGILVRHFEENPNWLRFGLPGSEEAWRRLSEALIGAL